MALVVAGAVAGGVVRGGRRLRVGVVRVVVEVVEETVEELLVQARCVERVAASAVRQGEPGGGAQVVLGDPVAAVPGGVCGRGAGGDDVGAHPVDLEGGADLGDLQQRPVAQDDAVQQPAGGGEPGTGGLLLGVVRGGEAVGVQVVRQASADHFGAGRGIARGGDLDGQPEAVEELGAELALLRVHRADQDDPGGVGDGDAVAFDGVAAHRRRVQEQIDEVVVQQVDLVDVQQAAVGVGEQTRLVADPTGAEGLLEVEGTDHPVLGGADRQLDQAGRAGRGRRRGVVRAVGAAGVRGGGVAAEPAAADHLLGGQQLREGADGRRLGRALLAADQDATDGRGDGGEYQCQAHVVGTDDGRERVGAQRGLRAGASPAVVGRAYGGRTTGARRCPDSADVDLTVAGPFRILTGFLAGCGADPTGGAAGCRESRHRGGTGARAAPGPRVSALARGVFEEVFEAMSVVGRSVRGVRVTGARGSDDGDDGGGRAGVGAGRVAGR